MKKNNIKGQKLRELRESMNWSQTKLVKELSDLRLEETYEQEKSHLKKIDIDVDVEFITGADQTYWSRLETGSRPIGRRERVLALIWGFRKLGIIQSIPDANSFLEWQRKGHLTPNECDVLFGESVHNTHHYPSWQAQPTNLEENQSTNFDGQPAAENQVDAATGELDTGSTEEDIAFDVVSGEVYEIEDRTSLPKTRRWKWLWIVLIVAGLGVASFVIWNSRTSLPESNGFLLVSDEFAQSQIDMQTWNLENAPDTFLYDGKLLFDLPLNTNQEWASKEVFFRGEIRELSQVRFTVILDTPPVYRTGALGIETGCLNDDGWLNVFIGGTPPTVFLVYADNDEEEDGNVIPIWNVESGIAYQVDVLWKDTGLEIFVNDKKIEGVDIPCNSTEYFSLVAGADTDERIRGFIDDIAVWQK